MTRATALLTAILFFLAAGAAMADKRVALVIGNADYRHAAALANPKNDAVDMADKLAGLGFDVVRGIDLDFEGMRRTIRDFVNRLDGADMALFYYAGHGLQVNGSNYLAPVDARLSSQIDLDFEAIPINLILSAMERGTDVNLVFLDACRDNPLAANLARSMGTRSGAIGKGLAKIGSGVGSLISFATQPGNVALDGKGRNSPFTAALLDHLGTPGQDVTRDLIQVRRAVLEATGGKQVPWENSSLTGDVVLLPKKETPQAGADQATPTVSLELAYWNAIKDEDDRKYFEAYLEQYPKGTFAGLARLRIERIDAAAKTPTTVEDNAETAATRQSPAAPATGQATAGTDDTSGDPANSQASTETANEEQAEQQTDAADEETRLAALPEEPAAEESAELETEPAPDPKQDRELVRAIQTELNRLGCAVGRADGIWGRKSEGGLRLFAEHGKAELASLDPSAELLDRLKGEKARICPLVCGRGQEARNGRCVTVRREVKADPKPPARSSAPRRTTTVAPAPRAPSVSTPRTGVSRAIANSNVCRVCKHRRRNEPFRKLCMSEADWIRNLPGNYICQ